jgi:hypothetical protein
MNELKIIDTNYLNDGGGVHDGIMKMKKCAIENNATVRQSLNGVTVLVNHQTDCELLWLLWQLVYHKILQVKKIGPLVEKNSLSIIGG